VAQNDSVYRFKKSNISRSNSTEASYDVEKKLKKNSSDQEVAESYYVLAIELIKDEDWKKAESYLKKAIQLVVDDKNNSRISLYYRELARVQEKLNKKGEAITNYENAEKRSKDPNFQKLNKNDVQRLQNSSTMQMEMDFLDNNSAVLSNTNNTKEKTQVLQQKGDLNLRMNQPEVAITNYQDALDFVIQKPKEAIPIMEQIASVYSQTKEYDKAIEMQLRLIAKADSIGDTLTVIQQLRGLATLYFLNESPKEGFKTLQNGYQLALQFHNIIEAKNTLLLYLKFDKTGEFKPLILNFINSLDSLLPLDRSLFDNKLFEITEEKIAQLEKEKELSKELISKKNSYNWMLGMAVILLSTILLIIIWGYRSVTRKNYKIALQSLRREMNPHFIFNSLNSVNQFIAHNNELEANKYLTSYSTLMRKSMENSNTDFITIANELEMISKYLELEKLRFPEIFTSSIEVDPSIDTETTKIPNMLIQPNIENAIWHGLRYRESQGVLTVKIQKQEAHILITIEDNGIGISKSESLKTINQKMHTSRGLKNVKERIHLLNKLYKSHIKLDIMDKQVAETGVIVKIEY
jgi:tetratricopeptide (TPR) repeat protein